MHTTALLDSVTDPVRGGVSPQRVGGVLKMSVGDLSRVTRLHRNTLTRSPDSPAVQARVGEIVRIIAAAAALLDGDERRAAVWFRHQPLPGFRDSTAEELVAAGRGEAVVRYLDELADGGFA